HGQFAVASDPRIPTATLEMRLQVLGEYLLILDDQDLLALSHECSSNCFLRRDSAELRAPPRPCRGRLLSRTVNLISTHAAFVRQLILRFPPVTRSSRDNPFDGITHEVMQEATAGIPGHDVRRAPASGPAAAPSRLLSRHIGSRQSRRPAAWPADKHAGPGSARSPAPDSGSAAAGFP